MRPKQIFISKSAEETRALSKKIALTLKGGDILALEGNLGAGKTTFAKGLGKGLGVKSVMRSPSFNLMKIYPTENKNEINLLIHLDCYRLNSAQEVMETGLLDYLGKKGTVTVIEWPEKIKNLLKNFKLRKIKFEIKGEGKRKITAFS
ncbi:MAG: tRNA (adenosine(37)-N6)-threonylcarbamoyltransferase complex ATPase subunit type 1 TsaE [Candidatus Magasanikbacteria bacterium]|nr:tRNA (adenosine(37)-N6)-threonylcarbamoyltransferase complex ATPase subunit type 1 TsaE [Candidatus Magasanikbacteria bacterium]